MAGDNCDRGYGCMQWWVYLLVPFINAIVGYVTNVIALYMTFWPLEMFPVYVWAPKGQPLGLFGWQGIIPAKAGQMAGLMSDLMTNKLVDVREVFSRVDPSEMASLLEGGTRLSMRRVVEAVMRSEVPGAFLALPEAVKDELAVELSRDSAMFVTTFMARLRESILDVFDLKAMCIRLAEEDKLAVNEMFLACGREEFRFIRRSGLYFGFLFGLAQLVIFIFYDPWWLAVIGGFIVGIATNYIALRMIFTPVDPIRIGGWRMPGSRSSRRRTKEQPQPPAATNGDAALSTDHARVVDYGRMAPEGCRYRDTSMEGARAGANGDVETVDGESRGAREDAEDDDGDAYDCCCLGINYTLHGLFLKRQAEVSKTYSELASKVFMTPENIWGEIVHGNKAAAFRALLVAHTEEFLERSLGGAALVLPAAVVARIKAAVVSVMVEDFEKILPLGYAYTQEAMQIERTLHDALIKLPSAEFERVLHPVFEEDELKLILVGGVLGMLAGLFQGLVLFNI